MRAISDLLNMRISSSPCLSSNLRCRCGLVRIIVMQLVKMPAHRGRISQDLDMLILSILGAFDGGSHADRWNLRTRRFRKPCKGASRHPATCQPRDARTRVADALAGMDPRGRTRHRASLCAGPERDLAGRVAVHGALYQGHQ